MPKTYTITITTDNPDGEALVREATEMLVCRLDWGDAHTTSVEAVEARPFPSPPVYVAGYEMEPGYMAVATDGGVCEACEQVVPDFSNACPAISDTRDVYAHVRRLSDAETVQVDA